MSHLVSLFTYHKIKVIAMSLLDYCGQIGKRLETDALITSSVSSVLAFILDFPFEFLCASISVVLYIFLMPTKVPEGKLRT